MHGWVQRIVPAGGASHASQSLGMWLSPRADGGVQPAQPAPPPHFTMGLPWASSGQGLPSTSTGWSSLRSCGVDQS